MQLIDQNKILMDAGLAVTEMYNHIPASDPFKNVYLGLMTPNRIPEVEEFLASREVHMMDSNAKSRKFRSDVRGFMGKNFPEIGDLRKSGEAPLAKANLDVGTLTNFAQITGGQSLGYVSLDVQMARGTVRPGSFTLYQALHKTRAYQVVDYWAYASDTGGPLPGGAFQGFSSVGTGTLSTSAGKYLLENINLKLAVNGRAITTALAAQNSFVDVTAQENINAALTVLESLNWASYWGNPTIFANQFNGVYNQINAYNPPASGNGANTIDYQGWYNSYASAQGWSPQQALFNLIYQWSGQITNYNQFGRITHAFMSPSCAGSLQGLATTLLNNIVAGFGSNSEANPIVVNGDLQGVQTRFGAIQFPIDMYITARDCPAQGIKNADGTNNASSSAPSPAATVTVALSGAASPGSAWTASYVASSGYYTYAVAATDASMNESTLTWATPISGVTAGTAYTVNITGNATADYVAFRVFRSGLGERMTSNYNPAAVRYIGSVAASGSSATASFVDNNTKIPGGETIFLFDMDEQDMAIDYRYLLPLTKIDLFAQNLFMPWAVTAIGATRIRVPKFHGLILNYVGDNPVFNPLSTNTATVV